jgi:hypothetical protein
MEILRVPPYPLKSTWTLPDQDTVYSLHVEDLVDHSVIVSSVTSSASSIVTYELTKENVRFDRDFGIKFYDATETLVLEDILTVYRPYVDPNKMGTTASEIAEYKDLEIVARAIIDDYTNTTFSNSKVAVQGVGEGTDYFPIWEDANSVLQAYENDILVYDADAVDPLTNLYEYKITLDKSAIYRVYPDPINRAESAPIRLPSSRGDSWVGTATGKSFYKSFDYTFVLDAGNKSVPSDVEKAAKILIEDMQCGRLDYYKRYVTGYNTDQFKISFDNKLFDGTGNIIVDKMLNKYVKAITRLGAL